MGHLFPVSLSCSSSVSNCCSHGHSMSHCFLEGELAVSLSGMCGREETQGTLSLACFPLHISSLVRHPTPVPATLLLARELQTPHCFRQNVFFFKKRDCFLNTYPFICFASHSVLSKWRESPLSLQMLLPHHPSCSWKSCSFEADPCPLI